MSSHIKKTYSILLFEDRLPEGTLMDAVVASGIDHEFTRVSRLGECLKHIRLQRFDVILMQTRSSGEESIEAAEAICSTLAGEAFLIIGDDVREIGAKLLECGAHEVLSLSEWQPLIVGRLISYNVERVALLDEIERQKYSSNGAIIEGGLVEVFDAITDPLIILNADYTIRFLNTAAESLLDSEMDTLIGEVFPFSLEPDSLKQLEIADPDGLNRQFEVLLNDLDIGGQQSRIVLLKDVTLSDRSESALMQVNARLNILMYSIESGVLIVNKEGAVEQMNQEASRLLGLSQEEGLGVRLESVLWVKHPRTGRRVNYFEEVFLGLEYTQDPPVGGIELTNRDGDVFHVRFTMKRIDISSGRMGFIIFLRDIRLENNLATSNSDYEKLNTIGLLASGIGHDFNNILFAVLGNISVARMGLEKSHPITRQLVLAEKAALQAKSLTQQLISFVKGGVPNLESTCLKFLVEDSSQFILRGSNVKCETHIADDLWVVDVDPGQMSQVINNLIINADQAMPAGGVLDVSLFNTAVSEKQIPNIPAGDYVVLSIKDRGVGIGPDIIGRIFEPYFTTKKDGNGLGLVSTKSIVTAHKGYIFVESTPSLGTEFKVYIPRSSSELNLNIRDEVDEEQTMSPVHDGGRILVMDDMQGMMMVAGEILKTLGYDVGYSTNGGEAIDAYKAAKEAGDPYVAVVFDLTVPGGMGGEEACQRLLEYDPDLIAIASSGYTNSNVMEDFESAGFKAVVPKPYRITEMSMALSRVLHKRV